MLTMQRTDLGYGDKALALDPYNNRFVGVIVRVRKIGSFDGKGYWEYTLEAEDGERRVAVHS